MSVKKYIPTLPKLENLTKIQDALDAQRYAKGFYSRTGPDGNTYYIRADSNEDEVEKLWEEWANGIYPGKATTTAEVTDKQKYCYHKWQLYVGVTERYEFCIHCDMKREEGTK